jgi:Uma2 family endonuclease
LPKPKEHWTVEEYLGFEKTSPIRQERVDGEICVIAGDSKNHNPVESEIFSIINQQLVGNRCRPSLKM